MITASHNPPEWNGFKIKSQFACSASQDITKAVEAEVVGIKEVKINDDYESNISKFDPKQDYFTHLLKFVNMKKINKKKWEPRTLPKGTTLEQMEEIFIDRYANLIVRLLDHLHERNIPNKCSYPVQK